MRLLALVIFVMVSVAANAQTFPQTFPPGVFPTRITPLIFNGTDLAGWKVEYTKADVLDGAVHVGSGNGWVRTEGAYADFLLTMDVKLDPKAQAGIFVRAWPTFNDRQSPTNGYRLTLKPKATSDDWTHLEVECVGRTITVRADGAVVYMADALENPQGHVAL